MKKLDETILPIDSTIKSSEQTIDISDDEILDQLKGVRQTAKNYQDERSSKRQKWYKEYRSYPYGNERRGFSQSVKSVIWDTVQGCMPGLLEIFTGDFFSLKSKNTADADKLHKLIKYQMLVKNDGESQLDAWIQNCLIYEFGVLKTYYKNEYETSTEIIEEEIDEQMFQALKLQYTVSKFTPVEYDLGDGNKITNYKNIKISKKDLLYSGPVIENIAPWEFFISPGATSIEDAKYVGHWVKRNLDYINRREKAGIYRKGSYEKILEKTGRTDNDSSSSDLEKDLYVNGEDGSNDYDNLSSFNDNHKESMPANEVWIREEYIKLDLDGDGLLENAIIVTCNDIVLSVSENPYKRPPFRLGTIYPEPHKVTGIPFTEILESDQKIQTNILRFLQDGAAQAAWKNPITNDPQLRTALDNRKPFDTIFGDPNKIGWLEVPAPPASTFNFLEFAQGMVENKTGVTRYNQGLDANSLNKTATGINIITSASQQKQKLIARRLNRVLCQVVRDFIFINQTWPPKNVIDIVGSDLQINPNDLRGEYTIEAVLGQGPQDKAFIANQIDQFLGMALKGPLMQMGLVNPLHVREALAFKGRLQDIPYEKYLSTEEEIKSGISNQMQQMQGQLQQSQQQIQGMGQQLAMLQKENQTLQQKTTPDFQIAMKREEIQNEIQLKKYELDLQAQIQLKKIEMELLAKKELELLKLQFEREKEDSSYLNSFHEMHDNSSV